MQAREAPEVRIDVRTPKPPTRGAPLSGPTADLLHLQRTAGNLAVVHLLRQPTVQREAVPTVQRTRWVWNGTVWVADGAVNTPRPTFPGGSVGAVFRDEPVEQDPFDEAETLRTARSSTIRP